MSDCFDDWNVAKTPTWAGRCREVGVWMAPTVVLALDLPPKTGPFRMRVRPGLVVLLVGEGLDDRLDAGRLLELVGPATDQGSELLPERAIL